MNRKISISFAVVLYMVGFSVWARDIRSSCANGQDGTPPGQAVSVAFLGLVNHGDKDRAIVAAYSDVASAVELHSHRMEDGVNKDGGVWIRFRFQQKVRPCSHPVVLVLC